MRSWQIALGVGAVCLSLAAQAPPSSEPERTAPAVGAPAPDFTLPSTTGGSISLSDFRGKKNVVIAFVVKAFTGG